MLNNINSLFNYSIKDLIMARQRNKPHSSGRSESHKTNPADDQNEMPKSNRQSDRSVNQQKADKRKSDAEHREDAHHSNASLR
jgi:hypothetical protein